MNKTSRLFVRRAIRESLGISIWLHAFYVTNLFPLPHLPQFAQPRYLVNAALTIFILNYSFFSDRGWWSVLFDLCYVYSLPFIYAGKILWLSSKFAFGRLKATTKFNAPQLILNASSKPNATTAPPVESKKAEKTPTLASRFFRFTVLWSIFVFTVYNRPVLGLVVLIVLVGALRAFRTLWGLFSEGTGGDVFEARMQLALLTHVDKIVNWNGVDNEADIRGQLNVVKMYQAIIAFIHDNWGIIARWSFVLSLMISIPFYLYMSYLFACCYFGVGRILGHPFPFGTAFLDSLYIPFAWTELPKNFSIRLMGGLQAVLVSAIGYSIFFRHLGTRFQRIQSVTTKLRGRLANDAVRQRIDQVEKILRERESKNNSDGEIEPPKDSTE
ncbi:MAG: hypothetical protein JST28_05385 [Acidobacteria bacterium]|nr:hypothetical protein [Acidobacteriota bacterium]